MSQIKKQTPLMRQYWSIKEQHMDKILLFRMGDFFEMFHDDAVTAAPILDIALTQRNKKSADDTPMCGVPHHSITGPIAKLLAAGHKVAICDQIEDPKDAKGIVQRAVTRVLTPGMVYDPETLNRLEANYICAFDEQTVSFFDASTGQAFYYPVAGSEARQRLLKVLRPAEVILTGRQKGQWMSAPLDEELAVSVFGEETSDVIQSRWPAAPGSMQRLLAYAGAMQGEDVLHSVSRIERRPLDQHMVLAPVVIRHLEMFATYRGDAQGSLFHAINRCKTSPGARQLKTWLSFPLKDGELIEHRLEQVQAWYDDPGRLKQARQILARMGDIERRLGKISNPNCNARDLLALCQSLQCGFELMPLMPETTLEASVVDTARNLCAEITDKIEPEAPISLKNGGLVRRGAIPELDELISLAEDSQRLLAEMEARERQNTGIPSLKIRYNNVFGFYIEVTNTHKDKVPDHYKRKQTLTNAERYLTQELQELEEKILSARGKRADFEAEIFRALREKILAACGDLLALAKAWATTDVISSLAWLALEQNYCRPQFTTDGSMELVNSRHAVVEQEVDKPFVPNSVRLDRGACLLLTGPNMAGKSTIMRQVAVIAILAQIGGFVPAESARLPIFDRVFTRIGASDFLAEGLSTFMVEMQETAEILRAATADSLIVLDEIGRGTSTYDGMSLAQGILEHIIDKVGATTLFATHYHELTHLESVYPRLHNFHMAIEESGGDIVFLHTLKPGPANRSYGIQVARLAGLPRAITARAQKLLTKHENFAAPGAAGSGGQMTLMELDFVETEPAEPVERAEGLEELLGELKELSLSTITPLDALNRIAKWQKDLS